MLSNEVIRHRRSEFVLVPTLSGVAIECEDDDVVPVPVGESGLMLL